MLAKKYGNSPDKVSHPGLTIQSKVSFSILVPERYFQFTLFFIRTGKGGTVSWNGNWVTFLDGVLQVSIMSKDRGFRHLCLPTRIRRVVVDPLLHERLANGVNSKKYLYREMLVSNHY